MQADVKTQTVSVAKCNFDSTMLSQQWDWGFVNETNINNWLTYGSKIADGGGELLTKLVVDTLDAKGSSHTPIKCKFSLLTEIIDLSKLLQ